MAAAAGSGCSPWRARLAVALLSFTILLLEIALTRILSVVLWYHYALLSISLAMLGLGAPGVWFALRPPPPGLLRSSMLAACVAVPASLVALLRLGHRFGGYQPLFAMAVLAVPMLCLGAGVVQLLVEARGREVARVYGADLLGAALGAGLVIPALHVVPTPALVAGLGWLPAAAVKAAGRGGGRAAAAIAGGLLFLLLWGAPLRVEHAKAYDEARLGLLYERWTPTARISVFDRVFWQAGDQPFLWGADQVYDEAPVPQYWLEQDGSAGTPILAYPGKLEAVSFLLQDVTSLGFQLGSAKRVAVIGAGGGRDILGALLGGASHIDAVEINGAIVEALTTRFRDFSGDVYRLPGVRPVVSEGRSFLSRSPGGYDLIQIALIDSWSATAAGAFALSENNLYTREAYRLYWRRLGDTGMVATSRWIRGALGSELPRLVVLGMETLRSVGLGAPEAHLAVARGGTVATVLMGRQPFVGERRARLEEVCRQRRLELLYPGGEGAEAALVRRLVRDTPAAVREAEIDLSPPTDDRPFFFHMLPVFRPLDRELAARHGINGTAVRVLQRLMAVTAVSALVLFFAPFLLGRRLRRGRGFWRGSVYFAGIGLGFLLLEVPWLQRFILYLGHPSHASTVVLAGLLVGAGAGSLLAARVSVAWLRRGGLAVALLVAAANAGLGSLFEATLALGLSARVLVSLGLLIPLGVPLGLYFPLGMMCFDGSAPRAWYWALNGAAGVLASVASLGLAMELGFTRVGYLAAACYGVAWLALLGAGSGTRDPEGC